MYASSAVPRRFQQTRGISFRMKIVTCIIMSVVCIAYCSNLYTNAFSSIHHSTRISVGTNDLNDNSANSSISSDGRYIAYSSAATNVIDNDTNGLSDIFVYDKNTNQNTRISIDNNGNEANGASSEPFISADGRYIVFSSLADNLVPNDTNGVGDIFMYDRQSGTIIRVSVDSNGIEGNNTSSLASVSADGNYVTYHSLATNLIANDTNGRADVFLYDRQNATTTRVSVDNSGNQGNNLSRKSSISADGNYIAYLSNANNLIANDTNNAGDVFLYDRQNATTTRVSISESGLEATGPSPSIASPGWRPSLSTDGQYIAFGSHLTTIVANDTNGSQDIFVYDRINNTIKRVSINNGIEGNGISDQPSISPDGSYIAFRSSASNLVSGDTNNRQDIFVYNMTTDHITRASINSEGNEGNKLSQTPSISSHGTYIVFESASTNLVKYGQDINGPHYIQNIFIHNINTHDTTKASLSKVDVEGNSASENPFFSYSGDYIVYESIADNLVHNDTNGKKDIFMYHVTDNTTTRVSTDTNGIEANADSYNASISSDGRYVAFVSDADNLVPNDTNNVADVFLHDNKIGTTIRISVDDNGNEANNASYQSHISADGNFIVYSSQADNLVDHDTNGLSDIFVYDIVNNNNSRVSIDNNNTEGNGGSLEPYISSNGRYIVFKSLASNLITNDTNNLTDIFLHDRQTNTTSLISLNNLSEQSNNISEKASVSDDGRYIAFQSNASNLVSNDNNSLTDIFVYDRQTATISRVSIDNQGNESNGISYKPLISANGRYIVFLSDASNIDMMANLHKPVAMGSTQIYVHDRITESTRLVSATSLGNNPNGGVTNQGVTVSANGQRIGWATIASDLINTDTNTMSDIYLTPLFLSTNIPIVTTSQINLSDSSGGSTITINGTGDANEQIAVIIKQYNNSNTMVRSDIYESITDNIGNRSGEITLDNINGLIAIISSLYDTLSNSNTARKAGPAGIQTFNPSIISISTGTATTIPTSSRRTSSSYSSNTSLYKDLCPEGDKSPSYYDNVCTHSSDTNISVVPSYQHNSNSLHNKTGNVHTVTPQNCYYKQEPFLAIDKYTDIQRNKYKDAIVGLLERCIFHGQGDTQVIFGPQKNISKAEVMKAIARAYYLMPEKEQFNHFTRSENGFSFWRSPYYTTLANYNIKTKGIMQKRLREGIESHASQRDIKTLLSTIDTKNYTLLHLTGSRGLSRGKFASILFSGMVENEKLKSYEK